MSHCRSRYAAYDRARLVAALRKQGAEVPAILISGHVTPTLARWASGAGVPVIEKPFEGDGLIELIRTTING